MNEYPYCCAYHKVQHEAKLLEASVELAIALLLSTLEGDSR